MTPIRYKLQQKNLPNGKRIRRQKQKTLLSGF